MTISQDEFEYMVCVVAVTVFFVMVFTLVLSHLLPTMTERRDISLYKKMFPDKE